MSDRGRHVRILLVRSWLHPLEPLRVALRDAGFAPTFIRTDIEPALHAALTRGGLDLVIYDPKLQGLSRETVETRCRELRPSVPLLVLGTLADLASRVAAALMVN